MTGCCALCQREEIKLTKHHLVPRKEVKRGHGTAEGELLWICRDCHNQLHVLLSHKEMADSYDTLERLLSHPDVARYVNWIRKRKPKGKIRVR